MKTIQTQGITYIEPLADSEGWYWGSDYASGDLYEAEELFRQKAPVKRNRLVLIHYPDGKLIEPVQTSDGQYLGRPLFYSGKIMLLLVDFPADLIEILQYDDADGQTTMLVSLPLSNADDCYNLMLKGSPLMLTRQGTDNKFQILWPETVEFDLDSTESFYFREGGNLYFSTWHEDPEYWEEVLVRDAGTGAIINRIHGSLMTMPDGQIWLLT